MKRLRYCAAMSLDGYIAGPNGEYDWIITDPSIDFAAAMTEFDTYVMGRKTFEVAQQAPNLLSGMEIVVFSRTLRASDYPEVKIVSSGAADTVRELKAKSGKAICLFGGGVLFRSLLDAGLVDTIELSVVPIILSQGRAFAGIAVHEQQDAAERNSDAEVCGMNLPSSWRSRAN
jgi:dihydrofolate reductase